MSSSSFFDKYYYEHGCGRPYERDEVWLDFFDGIASSKGWKLVTVIRKLRLWQLPKNSCCKCPAVKIRCWMRNGISHEN